MLFAYLWLASARAVHNRLEHSLVREQDDRVEPPVVAPSEPSGPKPASVESAGPVSSRSDPVNVDIQPTKLWSHAKDSPTVRNLMIVGCVLVLALFMYGYYQGRVGKAGRPLRRAYSAAEYGVGDAVSFLEDDSEGDLTLAGATTNLLTMMVGAGVLAYPSIGAGCGFAGTPMIVIGAGLTDFAACTVLASLLARLHPCDQYRGMVDRCIGARAATAVEFLLQAFIFFFSAILIVLVGENMDYLVPFSSRGWILATGAVMCAVAQIKDISLVTKLSALGAATAVIYVVSISVAAGMAAANYDPQSRPHNRMWPGSTLSLFKNFAVALFGFMCIHAVPTMRKDMARPKELPKALALSHGAVIVTYLVVAMIGYYGWGDAAEGNILFSFCEAPGCAETRDLRPGAQPLLSKESGGGKMVAGYLLAGAVVCNLMVTLPILFYVFFGGLHERFQWLSTHPVADATVRVVVALVAALTGVFLPYFKELLGILSATLVVSLTLLVPPICAIALDRREGKPTALINPVLILCGTAVLVIGLYGAVEDMVDALKAEGKVETFWGSKWVK